MQGVHPSSHLCVWISSCLAPFLIKSALSLVDYLCSLVKKPLSICVWFCFWALVCSLGLFAKLALVAAASCPAVRYQELPDSVLSRLTTALGPLPFHVHFRISLLFL